MNRRRFLISGGSLLVSPAFSQELAIQRSGVPLDQEPLGYDFKALEPYIDAATMEIHYARHHAAYVANLHKALASVRLEAASVSSLLKTVEFLTPQGDPSVLRLGRQLGKLPEPVKRSIRNNGGGHMNHTLFWRCMAPPGSCQAEPQGRLAADIQATFGGISAFKKAFAAAALQRFGSGWAWLSYRSDVGLFISTTAGQDNPLMKEILPEAEYGRPILCLDLWEHAYYLKYQDRRADYIDAWWNVVNWPRVERTYGIVTTTSS